MNRKLTTLVLAASMLSAAALPAAAAPLAGPCMPGPVYDPTCDVDQDNDVDIFDIQLTAGHWNRTGSFPTDLYWSLSGNAATTPGTNFLGTTDNQAVQIKVNGSRALLIQPNGNSSHNIVGGYSGNSITATVYGGTISGGGGIGDANTVTDHYGTVGGGRLNRAGNGDATVSNHQFATVGGGSDNLASMSGSTVGGGIGNDATASNATVGGGSLNTASGTDSTVAGGFDHTASGQAATIGGGSSNDATAEYATVGGGLTNVAGGQRSTVSGGSDNSASGSYATVPGGASNTASGQYSFAAGQRAKATHDGSFVWADRQNSDFGSQLADSFRVRALNGAVFQANNSNYAGIIDNDSDGDGLRAYTAASRGNTWAAVYANNFGSSPGINAQSGGTYAGYFQDQIFVTGGCTGCTLIYVAVNTGDKALEPGDLVAAAGVAAELTGGVDPVLRVEQTGQAAPGVVGVVFSRATVTGSEKEGEVLDSVQAAEGAVQPGDYLLIVVQGLAQVRIAPGEAVVAGQRLKAGDLPGQARALRSVVVDGVTLDEGGPVIGVLLDAPDGVTGLAPVMVTLR